MSEDMSPYRSAHDEWLIMKLCMYVGYHTANHVSHFGGDPIKLKKRLKFCLPCFMGTAHHSRGAATGCYAITRRLLEYGRPMP